MLNQEIFYLLHSLANQSEIMDFIFVFCARYLQYFVLIFVLYFLIFHVDTGIKSKNKFHQKVKEIALVFSSGLLSLAVVNFLKVLFANPRPFDLGLHGVDPLFMYSDLGSFPSGHAMFFSALAMSIYSLHPRVGRYLFVIAIIIPISRVIAGIHFPVDIFWGFMLGSFASYLFFNYIYKIFK